MRRQRGPAAVKSLPFTPILLRPLPHTVAPFPNEKLDSYRRRLAAANQLPDYRNIRIPSRWLLSPLDELERLELLSGQSRRTLLWAIPELRHYDPEIAPPLKYSTNLNRRACDRCGWQAGSAGQPIYVEVRGLHDNVCIRHRRWLTGGKTDPYEQIDVSATPEIVRAQILVNRLERRLGISFFAPRYRLCERVWSEIDRRGLIRTERDAIFQRIYRPDPNKLLDRFGPVQRFERAARFPQTARFTQFILTQSRQPKEERAVAHLTGVIHLDFERAFPMDRRPRSITIPWLRKLLVDLVEAVATDPLESRLRETNRLWLSHST
ncbi:hypothetical protein GCM10010129_54320 [Streptomyces fumigatiscleroticus]|nr:hypothetical protein GCM10010129_54320 [Streptomyces fumigatiscleroticus]